MIKNVCQKANIKYGVLSFCFKISELFTVSLSRPRIVEINKNLSTVICLMLRQMYLLCYCTVPLDISRIIPFSRYRLLFILSIFLNSA